MSINFRYVDYKINIIDSLVSEREDGVAIIFSDYSLKNKYNYNKRRETSLFVEPTVTFTKEEFFKTLFPTDRIILKENLRLITLYNSLSKDVKETLNLKNFNDFIMYGVQFFNFFKEKKSALINEFQDLEPWQRDKISFFNTIKKDYETYLNENNFIPSDWIVSSENLSLDSLSKFKKLIFVDTINFSNLETEIIKKIEATHKIEMVLQCSLGDFNETTLKMDSITLPEKAPTIDIFQVSEDLETAANLDYTLKEINTDLKEKFDGKPQIFHNNIFTPSIESCKLNKILPKSFFSNLKNSLDKTELFNFFQGQYDILATIEPQLNFAISLFTVEKYINSIAFKRNYKITENDIMDFYLILDDDFKYFSPAIIDSYIFKKHSEKPIVIILSNIYRHMMLIKDFKSIEEFLELFKKEYNILDIIDSKHPDIFEKLSFALALAKSCETLSKNLTFKNLFSDNLSLGILRLIIDDMKSVDLLPITYPKNEFTGYIKPLDEVIEYQGDTIYLIDIDSESVPCKNSNSNFFTEKQKIKNGLKSLEQDRVEQKYRFFQCIFSSEKTVIYFKKNEAAALKISPFLEEIVNRYNLEIRLPKLSISDIITLTENALKSENSIFFNHEKNSEKDTQWNIEKVKEDFLKKEYSSEKAVLYIGPYAYSEINGCYLHFYLKNILKIQEIKDKFQRHLSPRFIGLFSHAFLEKVALDLKDKIIENSNFSVDVDYLNRELNKIFSDNLYKIPIHSHNFFKEIFIPTILSNTVDFYQKLSTIFKDEKIKSFSPEKESSDKNIFITGDVEIRLTGKVDLAIESENKKYIIDYKTGKKNDAQLDFYSILLFGSEEASTKGIFNVLKNGENFETSKKISLTTDKLKESLLEFLNSNTYTLAEKSGSCTYCQFSNICKRENYF